MEDLLLSTAEVEYLSKKLVSADPARDVRELFRKLMGVADLVKKVVSVRYHKNFDELLKHLALLNGSNPLQTKQASYTDRDSNKLFELYVGLLAMRIGRDVRMDDPYRPSGGNPDVLATIDAARWGFACKVPYSRNAQSILDNIVRGVKQIEKSEANKGAVILGARNILARDSFWPELADSDGGTGEARYGAFPTVDIPAAMLAAEALDLQHMLVDEVGAAEMVRAFRGPRSVSVSGFLLHAMVASAIQGGGAPEPTSISRMMVVQAEGLDASAMRVVCMLNDAAQWYPRYA